MRTRIYILVSTYSNKDGHLTPPKKRARADVCTSTHHSKHTSAGAPQISLKVGSHHHHPSLHRRIPRSNTERDHAMKASRQTTDEARRHPRRSCVPYRGNLRKKNIPLMEPKKKLHCHERETELRDHHYNQNQLYQRQHKDEAKRKSLYSCVVAIAVVPDAGI